jgi:hypothetical protein
LCGGEAEDRCQSGGGHPAPVLLLEIGGAHGDSIAGAAAP